MTIEAFELIMLEHKHPRDGDISELSTLPEVYWYQEVFLGSFEQYARHWGNSKMPWVYPSGTVDGAMLTTHRKGVGGGLETLHPWEPAAE